jgi:glycosyltransferase involved in cell wall biosynthesis
MTTELVVLKSPDFGDPSRRDEPLPYRADRLHDLGFDLVWDDRRNHLSGRRALLVARTESLVTPWLQAWYLRRAIRRAPATLAFFESEGHSVALARLLGLGRRRVLVIMSCWLADLAPGLGRVRRTLYRRLYRHVDAVTVFSANQVPILIEQLGVPPDRVKVVPFGVDLDELTALAPTDGDYLLAVGRDSARDWPTLFAGVAGSGRRVIVLARASRLPATPPPAELELRGYVERPGYLELLAGCAGVLIVTREAAYPSGQTVMLEALALGKRCVVTDTAAMRSFGASLPARWVPVGDAAALRSAIDGIDTQPAPAVDPALLDARSMWDAVAAVLRHELASRA